jgi:hypothetical protein
VKRSDRRSDHSRRRSTRPRRHADVNWGRIETWHPAPIPFYDVGVLVDVGVYPLTIATAFLGPAVAVEARGWELMPDRVTTSGERYHIGSPDFIVAMVELGGGAVMRLTGSFYVGRPIREPGRLEFHGDAASLAMSSFQDFDAAIERGPVGGAFERVAYVREPYRGIAWGRGVADLARAIAENRPQRVTGEHAAHVVDILSAARRSMRERRRIEIDSTFEPPTLMDWAQPAATLRRRASAAQPRHLVRQLASRARAPATTRRGAERTTRWRPVAGGGQPLLGLASSRSGDLDPWLRIRLPDRRHRRS